jgi:succinate dehydrogenase hydrophobic anchor subunit
MTAIGARVGSFVEGLLYRGREGHLSFIGHRLAGLGTLLFLTIHILDTSTVYFGKLLNAPDLYTHAIDIYRSTPFMLQEILLVAAVIYHGVNGLKIILYDTFPQAWRIRNERTGFYKVAIVTFLLWAPAAYLMSRSLYLNNICHCAPVSTRTPEQIAASTNLSLIIVPIAFFAILALLGAGGKLMGGPAGAVRRAAVVRKTTDTYIWQFMRWSGVLLIPLAWAHVALQDVLVGVHSIDLDFVALRWATIGWRIYDIALLGFAFGHGMLGLRTVVNDYVHHPRWNRAIKWVMVIGWVVITTIGAVAIIGGVAK